jgi:hypothetical protein
MRWGRVMSKFWKAAFVAAAMVSFGASADDAPIRAFDIPTIERMGQAMYDQDQEAWKATDILTAQHSQAELQDGKARGWIVENFADHDLVRFIRDGANGPEAAYDVTFSKSGSKPGGTGVLSEPQDRTLSAAELAQHLARRLGVSDTDLRCGSIYNTVALKDPQGDGWLVWVMAATKDPDLIVIGGHTRFTISADGKTIRQKDALSKSCMQFGRTKGPDGKDGDLIFSHVVSLTPIETHVFASLSYRMPFRIGTLDGRAWKVDGASVANIDMDMPGIDGFAARTLASYDEACFASIIKPGDPKYYSVPVKSVIAETEHGDKYVPDVPADAKVQLIACGRNDFALAPNDYKVVFAGIPLMIIDRGEGHPKAAGSLFVKGGQFQFQTEKGTTMTQVQAERINARLNVFQKIDWPKN